MHERRGNGREDKRKSNEREGVSCVDFKSSEEGFQCRMSLHSGHRRLRTLPSKFERFQRETWKVKSCAQSYKNSLSAIWNSLAECANTQRQTCIETLKKGIILCRMRNGRFSFRWACILRSSLEEFVPDVIFRNFRRQIVWNFASPRTNSLTFYERKILLIIRHERYT